MPEERTVSPGDLLGYINPGKLAEDMSTSGKLVLKAGDLFAVTGPLGDIAPAGARDQGFFYRDTRFLSLLRLTVAGGPPTVLSSQVSPDYVTQIDMTVSSSEFGIFTGNPVNYVHIRRSQLIHGNLVDRLGVTNFVAHPVTYWLEWEFACDFADIFEVRGFHRGRRGAYRAPVADRDLVVWRYFGLDGREYRTELRFSLVPKRMDGHRARFELQLEPGETQHLELNIEPVIVDDRHVKRRPEEFDLRRATLRTQSQAFRRAAAEVETSDEFFNSALEQGLADLHALTFTDSGRRVIAAGIPWFAVPFGRDTLITAYQAMPFAPELARDSLLYFAAYQGTRVDDFTDEEPGKILHEIRFGEMSACGEIPHRPYYGSIDSTPLFLITLHEYLQWTDDRETVTRLLPAAEAALKWMQSWGDRDGDMFLEYSRRAETGLRNQGWKDSLDGVCFPDGRPCELPIALVEVQGYAIDALRRMALLFRQLGIRGRAVPLLERARVMSERLEQAFWMPRDDYFGIALDGAKQLAPTITSNPGHLLWSNAVSPDKARRVMERLLSPTMYSGWGIRTLAEGQRAYNPLSYHNGTVWPHDNSLIAMGFSNYGFQREAARVLDGLYHASQYFRLRRLPELFCGLPKVEGDFPVHYPVACSPQAWASGALLLLLRATLGLYADAPRRRLSIRTPFMPPWLQSIRFRRLRVGESTLELYFQRTGEGVFAAVAGHEGPKVRVRIDLGSSESDA